MTKAPTCLYLASYPGGIKIGVARDPVRRLAGLNRDALGVHKLEAVWLHSDPVEIEDMARDALEPYLDRGRERFAISAKKAIPIIHDVAERYRLGERSVPNWKRRQIRMSEIKRKARTERDMREFGIGRTESRPNQKITPEMEAEMEKAIGDGVPISAIAKQHKVAVATVRLRFNGPRLRQIRERAARKANRTR